MDTGAQCSVIKASFLKLLWPKPYVSPSQRKLTGANQDSFSVIGETQLRLQVNGTIIPTRISFVVVDDCVTNVILEQPFITEHVKLIKGHDGSLVLNTNDTASSTSSQEVSTGSSDNSAAAPQRIQEENRSSVPVHTVLSRSAISCRVTHFCNHRIDNQWYRPNANE